MEQVTGWIIREGEPTKEQVTVYYHLFQPMIEGVKHYSGWYQTGTNAVAPGLYDFLTTDGQSRRIRILRSVQDRTEIRLTGAQPN